MRRIIWGGVPAIVVLASSCSVLENADQYLSPVAAEIVLLNVPADALQAYGIAAPNTVTICVALGRITDVNTSSANPFSGEGVADAVIEVVTPTGTFPLTPDAENPGFYALDSQSQPEFTYQVGAEYQVNIQSGGETYWAKFTAADIVTLTAPEMMAYHAPQTDLAVTWTPTADAQALSMFNGSGELVYDNVPRDLNGLYGFLTQSEVDETMVPGSYFVAEQLYGIGLAGLYRSAVDEAHFSTNLNHLVSNAVSGTAAFTGVTTVPLEENPEAP